MRARALRLPLGQKAASHEVEGEEEEEAEEEEEKAQSYRGSDGGRPGWRLAEGLWCSYEAVGDQADPLYSGTLILTLFTARQSKQWLAEET